MKNGIEDLRNHLFAQLERLGDESLDDAGLGKELDRAKGIKDIAETLISSAKAETDRIKVIGETGLSSGSSLMKQLEAPKS